MYHCEMVYIHEATGAYVTDAGTDMYLCETCAESLSPRPRLVYTVMTRLESRYS